MGAILLYEKTNLILRVLQKTTIYFFIYEIITKPIEIYSVYIYGPIVTANYNDGES